MVVYLLKFSGCLLIFLAFYKLVLEKENMHVFKRFFLLGALIASVVIPLVTFTQYVEPVPLTFNAFTQDVPLTNTIIETETSTNYIPYIIWSIYIIGVVLFGFRFIRNLYRLNHKIKHNPKQRHFKFTHVLLKDLIVPHTFFNYIFFNKTKFETNDIPEEVFWHEQTHAIQKHSIDVIVIEFLQVLLWFNPLIYIIKHAIKLNHEFLADQGVLQKGINTNTYQEVILAFSTNHNDIQLANAINYSLIKKRFTVMKTQTTKRGVWLRSLILLPLLALTLYSFSGRKEVIKEAEEPIIENSLAKGDLFKTIYVNVLKNDYLNISNFGNIKLQDLESTLKLLNTHLTFEEKKQEIDGIIQIDYDTNLKTIAEIKNKLTNYGVQKITIKESVWHDDNSKRITKNHTKNSPDRIAKFKIDGSIMQVIDMPLENLKTINVNGKTIYSMTVNGKTSYWNEKRESVDKNGVKIPISAKKQDGASRELMKEYNKLAKHYNSMPKDRRIIKQKDVARMKYIYGLMNAKQKKNAEPFPNIPPPPPAPKAASPNLPPPPPPPIPANATQEQKEKYKKVTEEYNRKYSVKNGKVYKNPPPPPPPIPDNATPEQKKKYKENIKKYELAVAESRQNMAKVREARNTERAQLAKVKEQYAAERKASQEVKLARVAEIKQRQEKLKQEKLQRVVKREAITEERRAQLAKQKLKHVEERKVEIEKRQEKLKKEKLKHAEERKVLAEEKREYAAQQKASQEEKETSNELMEYIKYSEKIVRLKSKIKKSDAQKLEKLYNLIPENQKKKVMSPEQIIKNIGVLKEKQKMLDSNNSKTKNIKYHLEETN